MTQMAQMTEETTTDRIEKEILLNAPRERVWRALSDKTEFGTWFRMKFGPGTFTAGETVSAQILHPGYEHVVFDIIVVDVDPMSRFSYRWHPFAMHANVDYSAEPRTLIEFTLSDAPGGTLLRVVQSGFDSIPQHRRAEAFRMNDRGWTGQLKNIERHVTESE
jgi:uncharacterized protein YndB with AHSA1/START domain